MKKLIMDNTIPLNRKSFTGGMLEYRKNIIKSKRSKWKFWETGMSYFYDYQLNFLLTSPNDDEKPNIFYYKDVT